MNIDRFKNYEPDLRDLVLAFEKQQDSYSRFFDVDQIEIIADYYLESCDVEGLKAVVEYGEQLYPDNSAIRLRRTHLLSIQGDYTQALKLLKDLESCEPENTDVCYALANIYSMTDHSQEAVEYYLKAAADGYELDMIYGNIADEYYKLGMTADAVRYYRLSISVNPDEERSLYNLAYIWEEQGRAEKAVDFFNKHILDHPYSKGAWYALGCTYTWLSLYEKGADAFEYAVAIDKNHFNAYLGLSNCYRYMGDIPRAVGVLHDSLQCASDRPFVFHSMGRLYMEAGNPHAASAYFHDALKEDPSYAPAWNDLGRCCEYLGCDDEAAGYYRRAVILQPDVDEHWLCLTDLYIRLDRFSEAAALLESARAEVSDQFAFDSRLIYCYYKLGRRNRLFSLLNQNAVRYASFYRTLFALYPELSSDMEIVNQINILTQK